MEKHYKNWLIQAPLGLVLVGFGACLIAESAMLKASGGRFSLANPASWAEQAALLRDGKMDEFKKLTDELVGGVKK